MIIDSLDRKLINLLARNARQSNERLAKQLSVNASTVSRRIKRLIEEGVIGIVALPKHENIGRPLLAIITFDVAHDKVADFMKILAAYPEVVSLYSTTGRYDVIAITTFAHSEELYDFLRMKISNQEGLRGTETFICLHIEKRIVPAEGIDILPDASSSLQSSP